MKKNLFWVASLFIIFSIIYFFSSGGNTPYNYFTRLAEAFGQGKYWLDKNPSWLSELIPAGNNRFLVVYPPMPAVLAVPFVYIFGADFPQQLLAHLLGAGIVILTFKLSFLIKKDLKLAVWSAILAGLGTIIWFLASVGSAWYLGQITACFFLIAALVESLSQKRAWLVGLFWGAAYLSRLQSVLFLPLFFYLLPNQKRFKKLFLLFLGFSPFFIFNSFYNFIRFQTIFDKAYYLIPNLFNEPWYTKGLFNLSYIPRHLKIIFLALPKSQKTFPFLTPSWNGLAIWLTTPAFIYSLWAKWQEKIVKLAWLTIILVSLVIFSHGTVGFAQFGYRFAVDFYPLLLFLTIKGVAENGLKWHHWLLLLFAVIVNFWGVVWINKFGWVSF